MVWVKVRFGGHVMDEASMRWHHCCRVSFTVRFIRNQEGETEATSGVIGRVGGRYHWTVVILQYRLVNPQG